MNGFKVFALPANGNAVLEDDVNQFIARHRVTHIERQFVQNGEQSYWSLCIQHETKSTASQVQTKPKVDYKDVLSDEQFSVFSELRELRKTLAEQDGVPVFGVFSNEQLSQMVIKRVATAKAMKTIQGIGDNKFSRYGQPFIDKLANHFSCENA